MPSLLPPMPMTFALEPHGRDRLGAADRHVVGLGVEQTDVAVGGQHVLARRLGLVLNPVARLPGHHGERPALGRGRLGEVLPAVRDLGEARLALHDGHLPAAGHDLGRELPRLGAAWAYSSWVASATRLG